MNKLENARARAQVVLTIFQEQGAITSWDLASELGLPNPEALFMGRKVRHIIGDVTYAGYCRRLDSHRRHQGQKLPLFEIAPDGCDYLAHLLVLSDKKHPAPVPHFEEVRLPFLNDEPGPLSPDGIRKEILEASREIVHEHPVEAPSKGSQVIWNDKSLVLGQGQVVQAGAQPTSRVIPMPKAGRAVPQIPLVHRQETVLSGEDHLAIALASANKQGQSTMVHVIEALIDLKRQHQVLEDLVQGFAQSLSRLLQKGAA